MQYLMQLCIHIKHTVYTPIPEFQLLFFGSLKARRSLPLLPLEENDKDAAMKVLERQTLSLGLSFSSASAK